MEKFERIRNKAVRKWPGVPCCLNTVALYGKGILELPMASFDGGVQMCLVQPGHDFISV